MVTWSVICLPIAPPQPHASFHRTLVVVIAHHCSTVTHPRTDQATLTHPQMNQSNHCAHPPTTIVTRSDHLCFNRAFRSHRQSYRCYFFLSQACRLSISPSPPQRSIFSLKFLPLYHNLVLGLCHRDFCFVFLFLWVYILRFLL